MTGENEEETIFLLQALKQWLPKKVQFITTDFSVRLGAGVSEVFPGVIVQKCVFHAIQLFNKGLLKAFSAIKKEYLLDFIEEWNMLRKHTLQVEKKGMTPAMPSLRFAEVKKACHIYNQLRICVSQNTPQAIKRALQNFLTRTTLTSWKGFNVFKKKYEAIFIQRGLKFSPKGLKYIIPHIFSAFRAAIRTLRREVERRKSHFNKAKYLVLMNPLNMDTYHRKKLRARLKEFPWLRPYRQTIVKFYYQFRLPPHKRTSLTFLKKLLMPQSPQKLRSAVQTLLTHEEEIFRYQHFSELFPKRSFSKSVKVVNESTHKTIKNLYRAQCGMRTVANLRMRISARLRCPIIISPSVLQKIK